MAEPSLPETGTPGRTLAIGDIHGSQIALETLLAHLTLIPDDRFVILGDLVDRGPGTKQVIERLLHLSTNVCAVQLILGNHEELMLHGLKGGEWGAAWLRYGGLETLESYGGNPAAIPDEHLEFLRQGLDFIEDDEQIFIHANLEPGVPLMQQTTPWLRWTHLTGLESPHPSGKRIVCGHTPQKSGFPLVLPGWVGIDTFACGTGWLSCLDVNSNLVKQANNAGEFRTLPLI